MSEWFYLQLFCISQRAISANITNMTETQAKTWCKNYMNSSPAFLACQDIPNTNSTRAIEICVMDILVSENSDFFTYIFSYTGYIRYAC